MKIRVGHLYPTYLNIYADRGNIAVLGTFNGYQFVRFGEQEGWMEE